MDRERMASSVSSRRRLLADEMRRADLSDYPRGVLVISDDQSLQHWSGEHICKSIADSIGASDSRVTSVSPRGSISGDGGVVMEFLADYNRNGDGGSLTEIET
ncbi:hypothetical protein RYX36_009832 [Vicia faba]